MVHCKKNFKFSFECFMKKIKFIMENVDLSREVSLYCKTQLGFAPSFRPRTSPANDWQGALTVKVAMTVIRHCQTNK